MESGPGRSRSKDQGNRYIVEDLFVRDASGSKKLRPIAGTSHLDTMLEIRPTQFSIICETEGGSVYFRNRRNTRKRSDDDSKLPDAVLYKTGAAAVNRKKDSQTQPKPAL
jgi:hypothetical protein